MEQLKDAMDMLELIPQGAFCVQNGIIVKVNHAASAYLIQSGTEVYPLLYTGSEEYQNFCGGCLYLTLSLSGINVDASVVRMEQFDLFSLHQEEETAQLQALALAARELRDPLSNVMATADYLFSHTELDGQGQIQASQLNRNLFRMLRIIGNMTDADRCKAKTASKLELRDICAVLSEIFQRAEALTAHTEVTLNYEGYPERVYTCVDQQKLERLVYNILSNAIRFTPAGGVISAKLTRHGAKLYLSVCDSGSGIDESIRGSVFNRYARQAGLEDSRYGLGLGMVLIRDIATAHGGTVLVDHPNGFGTRVTVSFAIRPGEPALRSPTLRVDYVGELDHGLVELSDVLPTQLYRQNRKD